MSWLTLLTIAVVIAVSKSLMEVHADHPAAFGNAPPAPSAEPAASAAGEDTGFEGRAVVATESCPDGQAREILVLQARGVIPGAHEGWHGVFQVGAMDTTDPDSAARPLRCTIEELTTPGTQALHFRSQPLSFGEMTWLDGWTTILRVPIDALLFPGEGQRQICVFFGVGSSEDPDALRCHDEVLVSIDAPLSPNPDYLRTLSDFGQDPEANTAQLVQLIDAAHREAAFAPAPQGASVA